MATTPSRGGLSTPRGEHFFFFFFIEKESRLSEPLLKRNIGGSPHASSRQGSWWHRRVKLHRRPRKASRIRNSLWGAGINNAHRSHNGTSTCHWRTWTLRGDFLVPLPLPCRQKQVLVRALTCSMDASESKPVRAHRSQLTRHGEKEKEGRGGRGREREKRTQRGKSEET